MPCDVVYGSKIIDSNKILLIHAHKDINDLSLNFIQVKIININSNINNGFYDINIINDNIIINNQNYITDSFGNNIDVSTKTANNIIYNNIYSHISFHWI